MSTRRRGKRLCAAGYDWVIKGDPQRMTGQLGWGLEVDGDDYVQAEVFDDLKNTNSGTIALDAPNWRKLCVLGGRFSIN